MIQYQRFKIQTPDSRQEAMDFLNSGIEIPNVSEYSEPPISGVPALIPTTVVAIYYYGPEEISGS